MPLRREMGFRLRPLPSPPPQQLVLPQDSLPQPQPARRRLRVRCRSGRSHPRRQQCCAARATAPRPYPAVLGLRIPAAAAALVVVAAAAASLRDPHLVPRVRVGAPAAHCTALTQLGASAKGAGRYFATPDAHMEVLREEMRTGIKTATGAHSRSCLYKFTQKARKPMEEKQRVQAAIDAFDAVFPLTGHHGMPHVLVVFVVQQHARACARAGRREA